MGRITIFAKQNCKYCEKLRSVLKEAVREHGESQPCHGVSPAWSADSAHAVLPFKDEIEPYYGIELYIVDVSADAARSAQVIALTKSRTLPQAFFNDEHIGNADTCSVFAKCGELAKRLKALAGKPSSSFPPEPEAAFVKLTDDLAFSSQPTLSQIRGLHDFGFATLINFVHPSERCFLRSEEVLAAASGMHYLHLPPDTPPHIPISHIEVDLIPGMRDPSPSGKAAQCPLRKPTPSRSHIPRRMSADDASIVMLPKRASDDLRSPQLRPTLSADLSAKQSHSSLLVTGVYDQTDASTCPSPLFVPAPCPPVSTSGTKPLGAIVEEEEAQVSKRGVTVEAVRESDCRCPDQPSTLLLGPSISAESGDSFPAYRGHSPSQSLAESIHSNVAPAALANQDSTAPHTPTGSVAESCSKLREPSEGDQSSVWDSSTVWTLRHDDLEGRVALPRTPAAPVSDTTASQESIPTKREHHLSTASADHESPLPMDEATWTPDWCLRAIEAVAAAEKPVLIHCQTGVAACAVGLIRSARQLKVGPKQVFHWANSLGHNLASHGDLELCVATLVKTE
jgi:glutaredoxin/protein tyrosine phosphatase (PTP) superfamily phosphohydrolase (DUF442 family)